MQSLQAHCIHTQIRWSSSPPVCFPLWGTRAQSPGGYLCETGILLWALSRYTFKIFSHKNAWNNRMLRPVPTLPSHLLLKGLLAGTKAGWDPATTPPHTSCQLPPLLYGPLSSQRCWRPGAIVSSHCQQQWQLETIHCTVWGFHGHRGLEPAFPFTKPQDMRKLLSPTAYHCHLPLLPLLPTEWLYRCSSSLSPGCCWCCER